jgi:uncharacterized protein YjbI with pentapeptide repeats
LTKVNLFRGLLPEADLSRADCRASNFYECELWLAVVDGARFANTNLARTKLAPETPA